MTACRIPKVVFCYRGMHINNSEGVAPTVEHWTPNPRVVGSNPIGLTFLLFSYLFLIMKSI